MSLWEKLRVLDSSLITKVTAVIQPMLEQKQDRRNENGFDRYAFGDRVRTIRLEQDLSSKALSKLCKMSSVFIQHIEHGDRLPSLPSFVKLCNTLHVSPDYLLVDSINYEADSEFDILYRLTLGLTPKQVSTVTLMLDAIL